jgi:hypothetical protein
MDIQLENNQKGTLWSIMVKYENVLPSFSDSICKVISSRYSENDLLNISSVMDTSQIDESDNKVLDRMLGVTLSLMFFEF